MQLSSPTDWISVSPSSLISSSPLSISSRQALPLMSSSYEHFLEIFDRYDRGTFSKGTAGADEITPSSYFGGFRMLCGNKSKTLRAKAKTQYSMKRTNYSGMFWNIQEDDKGETTEEKQQQNDQVLKF